jgi:hypothetical protein
MMTATRTNALRCALLLSAALPQQALAQDDLSITANVPVVPVVARGPGRNTFSMPALEYQLSIQSQCLEGRAPNGLSLSVADTRKRIGPADIPAEGPTRLTLTVPADQIPPLVVEKFCIAADEAVEDTQPEQHEVTAALSMQAALLCSSGDDSVMTYASAALGVALLCEREDPTKMETPAGDL